MSLNLDALNKKPEAWAVSAKPGAGNLSSIKPIWVTQILNEAFGIDGWSFIAHIIPLNTPDKPFYLTEVSDKGYKTYVVMTKVQLLIKPNGEFTGWEGEVIASSSNSDLGDASKGAISDCLGKLASMLGVGAMVYRGQYKIEPLTPLSENWKSIKEALANGSTTLDVIKEEYTLSPANEIMLTKK